MEKKTDSAVPFDNQHGGLVKKALILININKTRSRECHSRFDKGGCISHVVYSHILIILLRKRFSLKLGCLLWRSAEVVSAEASSSSFISWFHVAPRPLTQTDEGANVFTVLIGHSVSDRIL